MKHTVLPHTFAVFDDDPESVRVQVDLIKLLGHQAHGFVITVRDESDRLESVARKIALAKPQVIVADQQLLGSNAICGTSLLRKLEMEHWREMEHRPLVLASTASPTCELVEMATAVFSFKHNLANEFDEQAMSHSRQCFAELIDHLASKVRETGRLSRDYSSQTAA